MSEFQKLTETDADRIDLCVELTAVRVAELLAKELARRNLSRAEFARMMEVTPGRVTQILDPDSNPQLRTVARALAVLGLVMDVSAVSLDSFSSRDTWTNAEEFPCGAASMRSRSDRVEPTRSIAIPASQDYRLAG